MRFRTSFFNGAVLRKNLQRCIPLIGIYTLLWLLILPVGLVTMSRTLEQSEQAVRLANYAVKLASNVGVICNLLYGVAVAMVVHAYLYAPRSANMIHALPIRREGLFLTNYVSGLLCSILPNLVVWLIAVIAARGMGASGLAQWLGMMTLQYLFFFGFSCFLAQLTGHLVALPIIYLVLNFAAPLLEVLLHVLLQSCVYGLAELSHMRLSFLSPAFHIISTGVSEQWCYLGALVAVGVLFAIGALLLYRHRKIETAGDVISVPVLRPVFKYCFAFGCAVVLGTIILLLLDIEPRYGQVLPVLLCMAIGGFIGYFGSEMALKKRIGVFRREWIGFLVFLLVLAGGAGLCWIDAFGYSDYQPGRDQISGVAMEYAGGTPEHFVEDPDVIDAVFTLHSEIISERPHANAGESSDSYTLTYQLKNGKTVTRAYSFHFTSDRMSSAYPFSAYFASVYDLPELVLCRSLPALPLDEDRILDGTIEAYPQEDGEPYEFYDVSPAFIAEIVQDAIVPDVQDGTLLTSLSERLLGDSAISADFSTYYIVNFAVRDQKSRLLHYYNLSIPKQAERTCKMLAQECAAQRLLEEP